LLSARSEVVRCQSDAQYHKEKCERLEESLECARQISKSRNELQRINADLQRNVSAITAEGARLEGEKRQAEMKMRLFETQLATARAAETRQAEDNTQLQAEIARQGASMTSIRRIEDSFSAKTRSEK
jgi:hypothetical protein